MADVDPVEGQDNSDRPEWLPDNFESPEAFATSYKEAQRKITELSQSNKDWEGRYAGLEDTVQTLSSQFEAANRPDPNAVNEYWENQYNTDPLGTMAQIAQATANQILQQQQADRKEPSVAPDVVAFIADQTMGQSHEDWSEYREKVAEVVAQNSLFQRDELWTDPKAASQALDSAYKMVKAEAVLSGANLAEQQAADTRAMKLAAQSSVGASGRNLPADDAKAEWDQIKAAAPKRYYE